MSAAFLRTDQAQSRRPRQKATAALAGSFHAAGADGSGRKRAPLRRDRLGAWVELAGGELARGNGLGTGIGALGHARDVKAFTSDLEGALEMNEFPRGTGKAPLPLPPPARTRIPMPATSVLCLVVGKMHRMMLSAFSSLLASSRFHISQGSCILAGSSVLSGR